jgi:hypothetical protein
MTILNQRGRRSVSGGFAVPEVYTVEVDDPDLNFLFEIDVDNSGPSPRVAAVVCIARNDTVEVRSDQLRRVAVTRCVRNAAATLLPGRAVRDRSGHVVGAAFPLDDEEHEQYLRARRREERAGLRRVTDDDLRRVAEAYRAALSAGQPPTFEVQRALRLNTRGQAARWVEKARDAGFLGLAPGWRRAGEVPAPKEEPTRERRSVPLPKRSTRPTVRPPEDEPKPTTKVPKRERRVKP